MAVTDSLLFQFEQCRSYGLSSRRGMRFGFGRSFLRRSLFRIDVRLR